MPSIIMDALSQKGHPWARRSSMALEQHVFGPVQASLIVSTSVVYFGPDPTRDLMRRGPLVASIALMALAAQAAQP
jgi:hypothetical protein